MKMKIISVLTALLVISGVATYFIGGYFVDFALVPNSGGQDREVVSDESVAEAELSTQMETMIHLNIEEENQLRDEWIEEMDLETRKVQIQSHDGLNLVGHEFEQEEYTNQWIIAVHGYQSDENETLLLARHFYEEGFNVLTISLRAHGDSDGDYIGMGYLDKDDLLSWTDYLVQKDENSEIAYHGTSMGGATVLMASGMDLPENVKAIVSDCAYSSVWNIFTSELKQRYNLPSFPVLNMAQVMGIIRADYNIKDGNVMEYVENSTLPILFIHTKADDFVPVSMVYELYEAKQAGDKELYILEDGGHAQAKFVEPESYYAKVFEFLENNM